MVYEGGEDPEQTSSEGEEAELAKAKAARDAAKKEGARLRDEIDRLSASAASGCRASR